MMSVALKAFEKSRVSKAVLEKYFLCVDGHTVRQTTLQGY